MRFLFLYTNIVFLIFIITDGYSENLNAKSINDYKLINSNDVLGVYSDDMKKF